MNDPPNEREWDSMSDYEPLCPIVVKKKSGKPFKSGNKTAIVSGVIQREVLSGTLTGSTPHNPVRKMLTKDFYTFSSEEKGYVVPTCQCEEIVFKNSLVSRRIL